MTYHLVLPDGNRVELVNGNTTEFRTKCHVEGCECDTTATRNVFCEEHRKTHVFDLIKLKGVMKESRL